MMSNDSLSNYKVGIVGVEKQLDGFVCSRCGACCRWSGHVLLTTEDVARFSRALALSEEAFIERYTELASNRRQLSLTEHSDGRCVFLKEDGCEFYEARPEQCRTFPHGWRVAEGCPVLDEMDKNQLKR